MFIVGLASDLMSSVLLIREEIEPNMDFLSRIVHNYSVVLSKKLSVFLFMSVTVTI